MQEKKKERTPTVQTTEFVAKHPGNSRKVMLVNASGPTDPETYKKVQKFLEDHPQLGYKGAQDFILMACVVRLAELHTLVKADEPRP